MIKRCVGYVIGKIKGLLKWIWKWLKWCVFREEGGKRIINKTRVTLLSLFLGTLFVAISLVKGLIRSEDRSRITNSDVPIVKNESQTVMPPKAGVTPIGGVTDQIPGDPRLSLGKHTVVRYKAKQVIGPSESVDHIPRGSNFIGRLLAAIDTRSQSSVQVVLPYGGNHKSGGGSLPANTVLFGQASYSGQGERVYLAFDHGVLPDGSEVKIKAQALSAKDYTAGIIGDFHGNTGNRIASVLGLSMVNGVSEVMVEKEALGQSYMTTPKASIKNGLYNGLAKVTEMEAGQQAEKLANTPEYVTIEAGTDLIVSLVAGYSTNEQQ